MTDASLALTRNTKRLNRSQTDRAARLSSVDPYMLLLRKDQEIPCDCKKNAQRTVQRSVLRKTKKKKKEINTKSD